MTLTLKNVDSATLQVIESLKALNPKLNIQKEQEECPICKAHDYTLSPKATKRLKKAMKEIEKGDVISYKDFESFKADLMR